MFLRQLPILDGIIKILRNGLLFFDIYVKLSYYFILTWKNILAKDNNILT